MMDLRPHATMCGLLSFYKSTKKERVSMEKIKTRKKPKQVFGVGVNDSEYGVYKKTTCGTIWICPFYATWKHMLERCYCEKYLKKRPTYKGCKVCDEWLLFSNFKKWMEQQDWEGKHLDKDLLVEGNKVYSPETCVFLDRQINNFICQNDAKRGNFLLGVHFNKEVNKFQSSCRNPFIRQTNGKTKLEHLGLFDDEADAHLAWKKRKHELANMLADIQSDNRVAEALRVRYAKKTDYSVH